MKFKNLSSLTNQCNYLNLNNCPICSSININFFFTIRTINPKSDLLAHFFKCKDCFHWFMNPIPKQELLFELYSRSSPFVIGAGWDTEIMSNSTSNRIPIENNESFWFLNKIQDLPCSNFLEVGIGSGQVFDYFNSNGWNCFGIEPGPWGINKKNIYPDLASLPLNLSFDLIIANDVLEHVQDPQALVINLSHSLSHNGLICLSVPYSSSIRAILMGRYWRCVRPLGHIHFFSKKSLEFLGNNAGLKIIHLETSELFEGGLKSNLIDLYKSIINLQIKNSIRKLTHIVFALSSLIYRGDQVKIIFSKY